LSETFEVLNLATDAPISYGVKTVGGVKRIGCAVATVLLFFLMPKSIRPVVVVVVGYVASTLVLLTTRKFGPRRARPWKILGTAGLVFVSGGVVRLIESAVLGRAVGIPSIADAVFLLGYVLCLFCIALLIRRRMGRGERGHWLDAIVPTVAIGFAVWALVLESYVTNEAHPWSERLTNAGFAMVSLLILACTFRLAAGGGERPPAYRFLAAAVSAMLASDLVLALSLANGWDRSLNQYFTVPVLVLMALAATHPSAPQIAERPPVAPSGLTTRRLALLIVALLLSPTILIARTAQTSTGLLAVACGSAVLSVLVLIRLVDLLRSEEKAVSRAAVLSSAGEDLLHVTESSHVARWLVEAVREIVGGDLQATVFDKDGTCLAAVGAHPARSGDERLATEDDDVSASPIGDMTLLYGSEHTGRKRSRTDSLYVTRLEDDKDIASLSIATRLSISVQDIEAIELLTREASLAVRSIRATEQAARQAATVRFEALVESSSDVVAILDDKGRVSYVSPSVQRMLGYPEEMLMARDPLELVYPEDRRRMGPLSSGRSFEARLRHLTGTYHWFEIQIRDHTAVPSIKGWVLNARHIGDRKQAEAMLARSETRFRGLVQNSSDIVAVADPDGRIEYASPAAGRMLGLSGPDLIGMSLMDIFRAPELGEHFKRASSDRLRMPALHVESEVIGSALKFVEITITDLRDEDAIEGFVLNGRDITERHTLEASLRHQANHDDLTQLANRSLLMERISESLHNVSDSMVALLFIDLDDFKDVNDSLGHEAGDQMLVNVSRRLLREMGDNDVAARLGGDEFAVLLRVNSESDAIAACERIGEALAAPMMVGGHPIVTRASIGIAYGTTPGLTGDDLLRNADVAMYLAKERGKGRFEVFQEHLRTSAFHRFEIRTGMLEAIQGGEMELHYQPLLDLRSSRLVGAEALVRWRHPDKGMLRPDEFIPVAEATGLIVPLGDWVMREAFSQLARWRETFGVDLKMSFNLSVRQLDEPDLVDQVLAAMVDCGIAGGTVCAEITESVFVNDPVLTAERISALRDAGVQIAIDDFGTGYSSLTQVHAFPFDTLKIDRSFVSRLEEPSRDAGIVKTILQMARELGVETVAEGIESAEQARSLGEMGCDVGQGYYFDRPLIATAFEDRYLISQSVVSRQI
jgi:diguanylate cyclase (GGDEF)-like protein/PAS domain S-box-containing protein